MKLVKIILLFFMSYTNFAQKITNDTTVYISVSNNGLAAKHFGGEEGYKSYIQKTICPYVKSRNGKSLWSFIVEKDGTYTNLKNDYNSALTPEQINIINCSLNCMANWYPAQQNGNLIRYKVNLILRFPDSCINIH